MLETGDFSGDKLSGLPRHVEEPRRADVLCGEHLGGLPRQTLADSGLCLGRLTPVTSAVTSSGWNSRFFGLENGFRSTANTWSRFSAENERIWRPRQHKRRRTQKTHFSEFAVFSAFCSKNGAVTKR